MHEEPSRLVVPILDAELTAREIAQLIRGTVEGAGARGVVLGLSGGVDSSLVATLCVRALGSEPVLGVLMPASFTPEVDVQDARMLAGQLGIRTRRVDIEPSTDAFSNSLGCDPSAVKFRMPLANLRARCRMAVLYYLANLERLLVVGTGDRSEALIGYFTKYGDGGADIQPIAHLYKTQVRRLAEQLGVPHRIACKPSSPQLYPGHRASDELPLGYEMLDPILFGVFDECLPPVEVSRRTGIGVEEVERVVQMHRWSRHKRELPVMVRGSTAAAPGCFTAESHLGC